VIDVACVAYKNYHLFEKCIRYNASLSPYFRFLVVDNTPPPEKDNNFLRNIQSAQVKTFERDDAWAFDGESHGHALDFLLSKAETKIVGTLDHDFFWIRPDTYDWVNELFETGHKAVGAAGWYPPTSPDWQNNIDSAHPNRKGWMAPVCYGQFLTRELATSDTFVCSPQEGAMRHETGWRIRKTIIEERIKDLTLPGFIYEGQIDPQVCFFGTPKMPVGMHLLKGGSRTTSEDFASLEYLLSFARDRWN